MLFGLGVNPNAVDLSISQKGAVKIQAENLGLGFFESMRELLVKENQLQVVNKEASSQADFLKPELELYKKVEAKEEKPEELAARIRELLKQFKKS